MVGRRLKCRGGLESAHSCGKWLCQTWGWLWISGKASRKGMPRAQEGQRPYYRGGKDKKWSFLRGTHYSSTTRL